MLLPLLLLSNWSWENAVNSSPPGQNGRHFAGSIFKSIFLIKKFGIWIRISFKFVPKGSIDNKSVLVQVMAWHRTGDKPLPEPMLTQFTDDYMRHPGGDELKASQTEEAITYKKMKKEKQSHQLLDCLRKLSDGQPAKLIKQLQDNLAVAMKLHKDKLGIMWCDFTEYWYHLNSKQKE